MQSFFVFLYYMSIGLEKHVLNKICEHIAEIVRNYGYSILNKKQILNILRYKIKKLHGTSFIKIRSLIYYLQCEKILK